MSRLNQVWAQVFSATGFIHTRLYMDAGSSTTRVMSDQQLVWNQPSCVTFHPQSQSVMRVGEAAEVTIGKTPLTMTTEFPIREGVLTNMAIGNIYFGALLRSILAKQEKKLVMNVAVKVAVPARITPVQKQLWQRVLYQAGFTQVDMVNKADVLFRYLQRRQPGLKHLCLLDIGSQTSEIALFYDGQLVDQQTILIGGDTYTEELRDVLRTEQQAIVSWQSAERLKLQLKHLQYDGQSTGKEVQHKIAVRAKDVISQIPTTVYINRTVISDRFKVLSDQLLVDIQSFLAQAPPEVVPVLMEQGLYITGGGSLLNGLIPYLEEHLKCIANPATEPLLDVVTGVAQQ